MTRYRIERSSTRSPAWAALSACTHTAEGARRIINELMAGKGVKRQGVAFRAQPVRNECGVTEYASHDEARAAIAEAVRDGRAQGGNVSGPMTGMGGALVYVASIYSASMGRAL